MTRSAPRSRTSSTLAPLDTPATSAPNAFAICTAYVPTPPDAPMISTFWPGATFPWSRTAWSAVEPEMASTAACSKPRFAGRGASLPSASAGVLGEGALADAEHLVARPEPGHVRADRLDDPGQVHARDGDLGRAHPEAHEADRIRQAGHDVPDAPVDAGRAHTDQHLAVSDRGRATSPSRRTSADP